MKTLKKAVTIFLSIVLWGVILLAALFAFTTMATRDNSKVASLAGFTPMVVETDSMSPTFNAGDLIIIKACDPATLEKGDIITFHTIIANEYALNTHRIEKIDTAGGVRSYTTKGDNNAISDTHIISDGDIVGVYVTRVAGLGFVMDFLSSSKGFLLVIVLPMLLFFIYQIYHLIMVSISLKKAMAVEEAVEKEKQSMMQEAEVPVQQPTQYQQAPAQYQQQSVQQEILMNQKDETEAILAEAKRIRAEAEAMKARAEAETALTEAKKMKAAAEAELARVKNENN